MAIDWHNPVRIFADYTVLMKLIHVQGGLYIWEFVLNLDFEYSVLTGKRKLTWTFPLYLGCRWSPLVIIALQFAELDLGHPINCRGMLTAVYTFGYVLFACASALIILRVVALWGRNKIIVAVVFTSWLTNVGIYLYSIATSHSHLEAGFCMIQNTAHISMSVFSTLSIDLLLLAFMFLGLLRWKRTLQSHGGILQLMYTQGLAWVLIVTLAEVPAAVSIALNLNDPMNLIFQVFGQTITALGASRIYRGLVDYDHPLANGPLSRAASSNIRSGDLRRSPFGSLHHNCIGDGAHGGGSMEAYAVSLSLSTPPDWSKARQDRSGGGDMV